MKLAMLSLHGAFPRVKEDDREVRGGLVDFASALGSPCSV